MGVYSFYSISYLFNYFVYYSQFFFFYCFLKHYCPLAAMAKKFPRLWENNTDSDSDS